MEDIKITSETKNNPKRFTEENLIYIYEIFIIASGIIALGLYAGGTYKKYRNKHKIQELQAHLSLLQASLNL